MKDALYWKKKKDHIICKLCPRNCILKEGQIGFCRVRKNENGKLISLVRNKISSLAIDPIEKKPLFHFYPGKKILSFGTVGCNLACKHCQNYDISREFDYFGEEISAEEIIKIAKEKNIDMIAATYNEPTIFYELMLDVFKLAKKEDMKTVIVSNGYINKKPLLELIKYLDAANIDLKAYSNEFYNKITLAKLEPVLETIKILYKNNVHLEITNLIIPTLNDDNEKIRELCLWIKNNLDENIPLHFSAFYPMYKLSHLESTKREKLIEAYEIAKKVGLKYVYTGNIIDGKEDTYCPKCNKKLIERNIYEVKLSKIEKNRCPFCGNKIYGKF